MLRVDRDKFFDIRLQLKVENFVKTILDRLVIHLHRKLKKSNSFKCKIMAELQRKNVSDQFLRAQLEVGEWLIVY